MIGRRRIRDLRGDQRGATAVELAFIALPLFGALLGVIDFGYRMYLGAVVEGTVHRAARLATVGDLPAEDVDTYIRSQLRTFSEHATIDIEKKSYPEYSGVGKPEKITSDTYPFGEYNPGDCYEDSNGNGQYDTDGGRTGIGGSDDIVYYRVTATFRRVVPLTKIFGFSPEETVSSNTVLRNQPYAAQTVPTVRCS